MAIGLYYSWPLALVILGIIPLILLSLYLHQLSLTGHASNDHESLASATEVCVCVCVCVCCVCVCLCQCMCICACVCAWVCMHLCGMCGCVCVPVRGEKGYMGLDMWSGYR